MFPFVVLGVGRFEITSRTSVGSEMGGESGPIEDLRGVGFRVGECCLAATELSPGCVTEGGARSGEVRRVRRGDSSTELRVL